MWKQAVIPTTKKEMVKAEKEVSSNGHGNGVVPSPRPDREEYACRMIQDYYR